MKVAHVWLLLLLACYASATSCYKLLQEGSEWPAIQQANAPGCLVRIPECLPGHCTTSRRIEDGGALVSRCANCIENYTPSADARRCDCAPGAHYNGSSCVPCPTSPASYCPGGPKGSAVALPCQEGLVNDANSTSPRKSINSCLSPPGYGIYRNNSQVIVLQCPQGTYNPGFNRRPCLACPYGLTTDPTILSTNRSSCMSPPGYFRQTSTPSACPTGTYQPSFTIGGWAACTHCPPGVTTSGPASTRVQDCSIALPGYGLNGSSTPEGAALAEPCPSNSFNRGGAGLPNCSACPFGWQTQAPLATSRSNCLVPPGLGFNPALPGENKTEACTSGFNPGWNRAGCTPCGVGVTALPPYSSSNDCAIQPGQGMIRQGSSWAAVNCPANSWGAANLTRGLRFAPCQACGRGLTAPVGSAGRSACIAAAGWYVPQPNGPAARCPRGTYKETAGNTTACTECPAGHTSGPGSANSSACAPCAIGSYAAAGVCVSCSAGLNTSSTASANSSDCIAIAGWYTPVADGSAAVCPLATYKETTGNATACTDCPAGHTTSETGSASSSNCTPCAFGSYAAAGVCVSCDAALTTSSPASVSSSDCIAIAGWYTPVANGSAAQCPVATYKETAGNTTACTNCPAGYITSGTGSTSFSACTPCAVGSHAAAGVCVSCGAGLTTISTASASTQDCVAAAGWYTPVQDGAAVQCPVGTYKGTTGNTTSCDSCPLWQTTGGTGSTDVSACSVSTIPASTCPVGMYQQVSGPYLLCLSCGTGLTTLSTGASSSSECVAAAGWHTPVLNGSAVQCPVGSFKESPGNTTTCNSCSSNLTTLAAGSASGSACIAVAGWYTPVANQAAVQCPLATYKLDPGNSTTCTACPSGFNTSTTGSSDASACVESRPAVMACALGSYRTSNATCASCASGLTTLAPGANSSTACVALAGWYTPLPGALPAQCPAGTFKGTAGNATACTACGTGLTTTQLGATNRSSCVATAGWFVPVAGGAAAQCPTGTYKPNPGNTTSCTSCSVGFTTATTGATDISSCVAPAGWILVNGALSQCPVATFKTIPANATECTPCPVGSATATTGSTSAASCSIAAAGFFTPAGGGSFTPCPVGTYKPTSGNTTACTACGTGLSTLTTGSTALSQCLAAPGFTLVSGVPTLCAVNTYKSWVGNTPCLACSFGTSAATTGSTSCVASAGYFIPTVNASAAPCPIGTFKTAAGNSSSCTQCNTGLTTVNTASTQLSSCVPSPGWYIPQKEPPAQCPLGTYTPGFQTVNSCTNCPTGFTTATIGSSSIQACNVVAAGYYLLGGVATACPVGTWKAVGNATACTSCSLGLTTLDPASTTASACLAAPGWYLVGGTAVQCPNGTWKSQIANTTSCTTCSTQTTIGIGSTSRQDCISCTQECRKPPAPAVCTC